MRENFHIPADPADARRIQERLRRRLALEPPSGFSPRLVAGADVSPDRSADPSAGTGRSPTRAALVVLRAGEPEPVDEAVAGLDPGFPYVPGLLAFRELPAVLAAWDELETRPDVVLFDGHGLAHPRRFGLACHAGMVLDRPTVGCAKSLLVGEHGPLARDRGATAPIRVDGEVVGAALRTRTGVRPVYVSPGHRMDVDTAVRVVLEAAPRYRLPEPIRWSHRRAGQTARGARGYGGQGA